MQQEMHHKHTNTYVAIMAGGIGSRFWPLSRVNHPKQFLDILGTGKTLIQQTFERFEKLVPIENIYVVTANEYIGITGHQLPALPHVHLHVFVLGHGVVGSSRRGRTLGLDI